MHDFFLTYNVFITAILFVLLIICIWNVFHIRDNKNFIDDNHLFPFVSVLIPVRNEEHNIERIVTSLVKQTYPNYEIIILNDNSTDNTISILEKLKHRYPIIKIISGKPLENEWTGKCFACWQLYEASKGEYLLFTDADTYHTKDSIKNAVNIALHTNADLLTVFPKMEMKSFSEKLIMPMLWFTIFMLLPFYFIDKKGFTKFSVGVGPFMLFKRIAYEKIGGHKSVKSALVEDVWLARKIKENNLNLVVKNGYNLLSVRMYRNFKEIWNGFSKNIFAGFNFSSLALFLINLIYILLFIMPFILLFINLYLYFTFNNLLIFLTLQVVFIYFCRFILAYKFKLGYFSALLHPFGAAFVPIIAVNSWRWIKSGSGARWKDRTYKPKSFIKN
jgi:chlorobactene glucosyltransferase